MSGPLDEPGFDPDGPGTDGGLFGLPSDPEHALVHVIPVPWEATASYGRGTRRGPAAVLAASEQVDLRDPDFGDVWRSGIALVDDGAAVAAWMDEAEADALRVIEHGGGLPAEAARVDALADKVHAHVGALARAALEAGRIPAVLGGDHSTPYGAIAAVAEAHPGVGVLHVDAHADLRDAYLGFRWSHASIFHNVLQLPGVSRQVGVAWRDMGAAEFARIAAEPGRIAAWLDRELAVEQRRGASWDDLCRRIVDDLPQSVYVSFDIDGLDPTLCPNTGTPVPGGLSWHQVCALLDALSQHRSVVGFDLCEVSPGPGPRSPRAGRSSRDEWDANVGARLLYKLAGCAVRSRASER